MTMKFRDCEVKINVLYRYMNGRRMIELLTTSGEPVLRASVNMASEACGEDEVFIKNWSENEGITAWLIEHKVIGDAISHVHTGYVVATKHKIMKEWL